MNVWVSILHLYILLSLTGLQTEHRNPEGRTYWFNTNTRESVWEKPDGECRLASKLVTEVDLIADLKTPFEVRNISHSCHAFVDITVLLACLESDQVEGVLLGRTEVLLQCACS